jgi:hypothetical protein
MKKKRVPFSVEIKIYDENGKKIFMWKNGNRNLVMGLNAAERFITEKLGVRFRFRDTEKETKENTEEQYEEQELQPRNKKQKPKAYIYTSFLEEEASKLLGIRK